MPIKEEVASLQRIASFHSYKATEPSQGRDRKIWIFAYLFKYHDSPKLIIADDYRYVLARALTHHHGHGSARADGAEIRVTTRHESRHLLQTCLGWILTDINEILNQETILRNEDVCKFRFLDGNPVRDIFYGFDDMGIFSKDQLDRIKKYGNLYY